jgi:hypothetical protein
MVGTSEIEDFNHSIQADRSHAQLLIQPSPRASFEEARRVIEGTGAHIVEVLPLRMDWVLVKLDVMDMREVSLRLTENGFLNIKGINALELTRR